MTTIARLSFEQAHFLKARLEVEGIPAFVIDDHMSSGMPMGGVIPLLEVQVSDEDVGPAMALWAEMKKPSVNSIDAEPFVPRAKWFLDIGHRVEIGVGLIYVVVVVVLFLIGLFHWMKE